MKTRSRFLSFPIFVNFASYDDVIPPGGAARAIPSDVIQEEKYQQKPAVFGRENMEALSHVWVR